MSLPHWKENEYLLISIIVLTARKLSLSYSKSGSSFKFDKTGLPGKAEGYHCSVLKLRNWDIMLHIYLKRHALI